MNKRIISLLMMLVMITAQQVQAIDWSQYYNAICTKNNGIIATIGCGAAAAWVLHPRRAYMATLNSYYPNIEDSSVCWWKVWQSLPMFNTNEVVIQIARQEYYAVAKNYKIRVGIIAGIGLTKIAADCYFSEKC